MWADQLSLLSKAMPRNLKVSTGSMLTPDSRRMGSGSGFFLLVNVSDLHLSTEKNRRQS